jgi:hypothetical protein
MSGSDGGSNEVKDLRRLIASNLPDNVTLVILTTSSRAASIRSTYEQWLPKERLIVASDNDPSNVNGYWARDSFPIPVWNPQLENTSLVSMKYFRTFNSGGTVGNAVAARMISFPNTFVGGNLLADEDGNCFVINSERLFGLSESDLQRILGCKTATLLPHVAGIGDVDEVLKPIPGKRMLTTQISYKARLESMGYEVIMLPSLSDYKFRTYANALVVGSTAFMPAFGLSTDRDAAKVYESLGYRVVPIRTNQLSDNDHGSIHCQTMAYPPMPQQMLLDALGVSKN